MHQRRAGGDRERRYSDRRRVAGDSGASALAAMGPTSDQFFRQRPTATTAIPRRPQSERRPPAHQYYPNGQFHMLSSSPVALSPSLSPLYRPPNVQPAPSSSSGTTSAVQAAVDEEVGQLFTMHLPVFFDALEKFQYHQALAGLDASSKSAWKGYSAFSVMLNLGASCESTYHSMKYLEPDLLSTNTIEQMYDKLVVLLNHLADELRPIVERQSHHYPVVAKSPNMNGSANSAPASGGSDDNSYEDGSSDRMLMMEIAMCGDMSYYVELLEQSAEFFSLRIPMLQLYRRLARSSVPRDYRSTLKLLEALLLRFDMFDHPLLETMKQSAIEELSTVHAAIQCDIHVGQYDFTRSMAALHKLKVQLRSWSDHIDAVSDYPMFDEPIDEPLLLPDEDTHDAAMSDSMYSSTSFSNQSTSSFLRGGQLPFTSTNGSESFAPPAISSSVLSSSGLLYSTSRYASMGDTAYDNNDDTAMFEKQSSLLSAESNVSPVSEAAPSGTLTRLLSQSNILKRSGLLTSALPIPFPAKGLVQKPGDPYTSSGGVNSVPSNTLEQAILGGGSGSTTAGGGSGQGSGAGGGGGSGGVNGANTLAAEMIALSVKKQERDDGFALPVYQWSRRFFRSLLAKYTLYFYQWLDPYERSDDYLSLDLTRFVRTPLGISYLQLMDVLLSRGSHRSDDVKTHVMLLLETQQLDDRGAHYYQSGYLCPSSSKTRSKRPELDDDESTSADAVSPKEAAGFADHHGSTEATAVQGNQYSLFMQVDREQDEEHGDFSELWGLRSWPAVFSYPAGPLPLEHWPNLVSLIMDNRTAINSYRPAFTHTERKMKTVYFISRVDDAMFLVLLIEGTRRPNEKIAQDFMQSVTENLQHSGVFEPRVAPLSSHSSSL